MTASNATAPAAPAAIPSVSGASVLPEEPLMRRLSLAWAEIPVVLRLIIWFAGLLVALVIFLAVFTQFFNESPRGIDAMLTDFEKVREAFVAEKVKHPEWHTDDLFARALSHVPAFAGWADDIDEKYQWKEPVAGQTAEEANPAWGKPEPQRRRRPRLERFGVEFVYIQDAISAEQNAYRDDLEQVKLRIERGATVDAAFIEKYARTVEITPPTVPGARARARRQKGPIETRYNEILKRHPDPLSGQQLEQIFNQFRITFRERRATEPAVAPVEIWREVLPRSKFRTSIDDGATPWRGHGASAPRSWPTASSCVAIGCAASPISSSCGAA
jgi:hypothetical protein